MTLFASIFLAENALHMLDCWEIVQPYNAQINHRLPKASPKLQEQSFCLSHPHACPFHIPIGIDGHVNV